MSQCHRKLSGYRVKVINNKKSVVLTGGGGVYIRNEPAYHREISKVHFLTELCIESHHCTATWMTVSYR